MIVVINVAARSHIAFGSRHDQGTLDSAHCPSSARRFRTLRNGTARIGAIGSEDYPAAINMLYISTRRRQAISPATRLLDAVVRGSWR